MQRMRTRLSAILLIAVASLLPASAQQRLIVSPEHPRHGDTVLVEYDAAASGAVLKSGVPVVATVEMDARDRFPIPMKQNGTRWRGSFCLTDTATRAFFVTLQAGEYLDDNDGRTWPFCVYGKDGIPLERAQYIIALRYSLFADMEGLQAFPDSAIRFYERELACYPDEIFVRERLWAVRLAIDSSAATMAGIHSEVLDQYERCKEDGTPNGEFLDWLMRVGEEQKAAHLKLVTRTVNPHSDISIWMEVAEANGEPDFTRRIAGLRALLSRDFGSMKARERVYEALADAYQDAKSWDSAATCLDAMTEPSAWRYSTLSEMMRNAEGRATEALSIAARGVDRCLHRDAEGRPRLDRPGGRYVNDSRVRLAVSYIRALQQNGCSDSALAFCLELSASTEGKSTALNDLAIPMLYKKRRYAEALSMIRTALEEESASEDAVNYLRQTLVRTGVAQSALGDTLAAIRESFRPRFAARVRARSRFIPAFDRNLFVEGGRVLRIADLKGRVAVVWYFSGGDAALLTFATLHYLGERFRDDERVALYAVYTRDDATGEALESKLDVGRKLIGCDKVRVVVDADPANTRPACGLPKSFTLDRKGRMVTERNPDGQIENSMQSGILLEEKIRMLLED